jgi:TRAP-type transport system periplasmic protein
LPEGEKEHTGIKQPGLFQYGPGVLMLKNKRVDTPEDFKGLRIRTSGSYVAQLVTDLGAEHVGMSPTEVRQALIDGAVDGVMFPYEGADAFNLMDQITFVSELPGGYYNATLHLSLPEAAAARIGPELTEVLARISSETVDVLAAKSYDYADYVVKQELIKTGTEVAPVSEAVAAFVKSYMPTATRPNGLRGCSRTAMTAKKALACPRRIAQGG